MPRKIVAAEPSPTAPPMPISLLSAKAEGFHDHRQYSANARAAPTAPRSRSPAAKSERETHHACGICHRERRSTAADEAEDEGRPGPGRARQRIDRTVERQQSVARHSHFQQEQRQRRLEHKSRNHRAPRKRAPILGQRQASATMTQMPKADCRCSSMKNPRALLLFKAEGGLRASRPASISSPPARGQTRPGRRSYGRRASIEDEPDPRPHLCFASGFVRQRGGVRRSDISTRGRPSLSVRSHGCALGRILALYGPTALRNSVPQGPYDPWRMATGLPSLFVRTWGRETAFQPPRAKFNVTTVMPRRGVGCLVRSPSPLLEPSLFSSLTLSTLLTDLRLPPLERTKRILCSGDKTFQFRVGRRIKARDHLIEGGHRVLAPAQGVQPEPFVRRAPATTSFSAASVAVPKRATTSS